MRICKDGRIWGQNNREAGSHLGILKRGRSYRKGTASTSKLGKLNPMYRRRHTTESKEKMRIAQKGSKGSNWKGGISSRTQILRSRIQYRLWRDAVYARDNWTCQECGGQGWRLNAHHIKSLRDNPELKYAIDNGQTLCFDCHRLTDNFAGRYRKL